MVNYLLPQSALTINAAPMTNALNQYRQGMNQQFQAERQADWRKEDMNWRQTQANKAEANSLRNYNLTARRFDADQEFRNKQLGMQEKRFGLEQQRFGANQDARKEVLKSQLVKNAAGVAQLVAGESDPARQAAMWQQFVAVHPRVAASLPPELRNNPAMGAQFVMAQARGYVDPIQQQLLHAKMAAANAKAAGKANVTPETSRNISGGLNRLAQVPSQYSTGDLENAIGTLQGDDNGGILTSLSRVFGSVMSSIGGVSPTEIRDRIRGDTEALAAAIKPLIRKPGEGAWTDEDQARLVSVVGDLARANTPKQYMQRLQDVRQRVMSNFGVPLPEIGATGPQASPKALRSMSTEELMRRRQELTGNGQ